MTKVDKRLLADIFLEGIQVGSGLSVDNSTPTTPVISPIIATQAEAEAGLATNKLMNPLRVAQAITALSPPTDLSAIALELADLKGGRLAFKGGIADPFDDETGVSANQTSYSNSGGIGARTSSITVTSTFTADAGTPAQFVDGITTGSTGYNWSLQTNTGKYLQFDFGSSVIIEEFKFYQNAIVSHGIFHWEASNSASSGYIVISGDFTLGNSLIQTQIISASNQTTYRYWRLIGVSGTVQNSPWLQEIEFKIGTITGQSLNQIYDASNDLYRPSSTGISRISGGTPSSLFGGTPANFNDNNSATIFTSGTIGTITSQPVSGRIIAKIDFGSIKDIQKIELLNYYLSGAGSSIDSFYTSLDNVNWTQYGSTFTSTNSPISPSFTAFVSARYIAVVLQAQGFGALNVSLGDLNAYENAAPNNMTLISVGYPITVQPTKARLVIQLDTSLTVVAGTDFSGEVSRNDGVNWTNTPLTLSTTLGTVKTYESASVDISAQPTGSIMRWRAKTLTNKNIAISGIVEQWS